MDPLSLMFLASQIQSPGVDAFANPTMMGSPTDATTADLFQPSGGNFADILGALKAPGVPKPQLSGGVSGAGLPFRTAITDLLSPVATNLRQSQTQTLPTLGALFAQAPGGGR